jgi:cytochrome c biogenesis protein CcmG/thiol:disulfide interchange protein DsbE
MRRPWLLWLPLALFGLFFGIVSYGLINPADRTIESRLIGQKLPAFTLPAATPGVAGLSAGELATGGEPRLLNIFASWCLPCIAEAPVLEGLARQGVAIDAIAIRDRPEDVAAFLKRNGNPYQRIGSDMESRVQLALGSSGVPETFVVDGKGVIRYQHVGDIRPEHVATILEELRKAR